MVTKGVLAGHALEADGFPATRMLRHHRLRKLQQAGMVARVMVAGAGRTRLRKIKQALCRMPPHTPSACNTESMKYMCV